MMGLQIGGGEGQESGRTVDLEPGIYYRVLCAVRGCKAQYKDGIAKFDT